MPASQPMDPAIVSGVMMCGIAIMTPPYPHSSQSCRSRDTSTRGEIQHAVELLDGAFRFPAAHRCFGNEEGIPRREVVCGAAFLGDRQLSFQ